MISRLTRKQAENHVARRDDRRVIGEDKQRRDRADERRRHGQGREPRNETPLRPDKGRTLLLLRWS